MQACRVGSPKRRRLVLAGLERLVPGPGIDGRELIAVPARRYRDRSMRVQHVEQPRFCGIPLPSEHLGIGVLVAEIGLPEISSVKYLRVFEPAVEGHSASLSRYRKVHLDFPL